MNKVSIPFYNTKIVSGGNPTQGVFDCTHSLPRVLTHEYVQEQVEYAEFVVSECGNAVCCFLKAKSHTSVGHYSSLCNNEDTQLMYARALDMAYTNFCNFLASRVQAMKQVCSQN